MSSFVTEVEEIRARAEQKIDEGDVTDTYEGDVEQTISILNEALATEIVCVLRYMHHHFMATGVHGMAVRDEFKEHADAEREHADEIAEWKAPVNRCVTSISFPFGTQLLTGCNCCPR
jgi:bacterioferritin